MKHSIAAPILAIAILALQATAAVVDYVSGEPISSSGYYQYHTKWVTTTCYETITKSKDCSYDGGDFVGDYYKTVSPQVYPGPDYKDYKTVYETVYETPYPHPYEIASTYPYETAQPYPYDPVCYPETVYSTVYPESSHTIDHTFTASGTDETVTGSTIYHTMDSTIMETVTATPSGGSELECSPSGPWIVNPGFEDSSWPGAWFTSGPVDRVTGDTSDGSAWFARLTVGGEDRVESLLEQAIIMPINGQHTFKLRSRASSVSNPGGYFTFIFSLGSYYSSQSANLPIADWYNVEFVWSASNGPSGCVPVVFSIKVAYQGSDGGDTIIDLDGFQLT